MNAISRICPWDDCAGYPHTWEILNPRTGRTFRRGRVIFSCPPHWTRAMEVNTTVSSGRVAFTELRWR